MKAYSPLALTLALITPAAFAQSDFATPEIKGAGLPDKFKEFGTGFIKTDRWIETINNSTTAK